MEYARLMIFPITALANFFLSARSWKAEAFSSPFNITSGFPNSIMIVLLNSLNK